MAEEISSESHEYYQKTTEGWTIKAIAGHFGVSIGRVRRHLSTHPQYTPPGRGNKTSRSTGKAIASNITHDFRAIGTPIHPDLHVRLDRLAIKKNKTKNDLVRQAIEEFCDRQEKSKKRTAKKS